MESALALLSDVRGAVCTKSDTELVGHYSLIVALALPHFLYCFVWFKPQIWQRIMGNRSLDIFVGCGIGGKVLQLLTILAWSWSHRQQGMCVDMKAITYMQWVNWFLLCSLGQSLNYGIYQAIGHKGVYYGYKLGAIIPWHDGFPFDVVAHPQYVGSVMTIWAVCILLYNQFPPIWLPLSCYWTLLYVITGCWEEFTP